MTDVFRFGRREQLHNELVVATTRDFDCLKDILLRRPSAALLSGYQTLAYRVSQLQSCALKCDPLLSPALFDLARQLSLRARPQDVLRERRIFVHNRCTFFVSVIVVQILHLE